MTAAEANRRRAELRAALERIVDLALECKVDALTIAGDLFEHEYATEETGRFLARQFRRLAPIPVLIAPGNHDPYIPGSLYLRVEWPDSVTVFDSSVWRPARISRDVFVWGIGHDGPAMRRDVLSGLRLNDAATNVLLLHGADVSRPVRQDASQCPFQPADVARSGAAFALLGHEHTWRLSTTFAYPGSPEPLGFFTEGAHHVALATVQDGSVRVERVQVSGVTYQTVPVDISRCANVDGVLRALERVADGIEASAIVRFLLTGERRPAVQIEPGMLLRGLAGRLRYGEVIDETTLAPLRSTVAGPRVAREGRRTARPFRSAAAASGP